MNNIWRAIKGENTKQILFAAVPLIIFGFNSAYLLVAGEAEWFSRLGSLIVAWALVFLALKRESYSRYLLQLERTRLLANINRDRAIREYMQQGLAGTFDLHATQIAHISYRLGIENPFVENNSRAIKDFCLQVEERLKDAPWTKSSERLISEEREDERFYHQELKKFSAWGDLIWRLEVLLIVWGTVQWGYGDLLVDWLTNLGWVNK